MPPTFADHFSGVAAAYAENRPSYPDRLFSWLATLVPRRELAWDCATGSGQAAFGLVPYFQRIIATDASAAQIAAARPHPRIEYRVAPAEASTLESESADLVVVGQALHWFDRPAFFAEAKRVLRPRAVLAAWTYGGSSFDEPRLDSVHRAFYVDVVGPWWPPERSLVEAGYRNVEFPFEEIPAPVFDMETHWPLSTFIGYVGTWSAVTRFRNARGIDPVPELARELAAAWGDPQAVRRIRWPVSVRAGRKT